jgi:hypothetical protein
MTASETLLLPQKHHYCLLLKRFLFHNGNKITKHNCCFRTKECQNELICEWTLRLWNLQSELEIQEGKLVVTSVPVHITSNSGQSL